MVDLMHLGMFGIIFLILIGFASNTGESFTNIEDQMFLMNCPMPISDGVATLNSIEGFALNYTVVYGSGNNNSTGTFFECTADDGLFGANTVIKEYGATFAGIPYGWFVYFADFISAGFQSMQALFTLISFFVTPVNFNILGFTIADLGGMGLFMIVAIYAFCYISIGIMLYKIISPFAGVG